ncbi:MAG: photosynthetic reaction center cytochrome c subunit [Betaproteobacteria bacterium]|nr:photosynthetic reaction center cytochrome c subunit [Betaproteobacteria bacterium]
MNIIQRLTTAVIALGTLLALAGCERGAPFERPPVDSVQSGYRGTGMLQVYNPRILEPQIEQNQPPAALPPASSEGPKASQVYQNVKVLGDLSVAEFARHMTAITAWVSPNEGCVYCHNPANFAEDSKYTKVVARRMIQMTQHINVDWQQHVSNTGVTCYTCHRGQPVPSKIWFTAPGQNKGADFIGNKNAQNTPDQDSVKGASLPYDHYTEYFKEAKPIRVAGNTALPTGNRASIQQGEYTYGLMMHMSDSLGVNCTYCHNSRNFGDWSQSPPQRTTAWYGIRMVRDLNLDYMEDLTSIFPVGRKGPLGDVAKVNCATCHQGAYKPLYGAKMAKDHPELTTLVQVVAGAGAGGGAGDAQAVKAAADAVAGTKPAPSR